MRQRLGYIALSAVLSAIVAACGDAPLTGLGDRSSGWIGEPTIVTTTTVPVTVPIVIGADALQWFNDSIVSQALSDPNALRREIFNRRGGELIVQASRLEIATLVPDLKFPASAPYQAEYVTSQVVFDGTGRLSKDPIAGFGIWSSEPYTRSRTVAQMVVLWVSSDEAGAVEVAEAGQEITCARFSDATTTSCELLDMSGVPVWSLFAGNGRTLIWFDGIYRYELFGRAFVPERALLEMVPSLTPLSELPTAPLVTT